MSTSALSLDMLVAEKGQAHLIAFDTKFQKAMAVDGPGLDYVDPYCYKPSINPGTHLVRLPIPLSAPELKLFKGSRHFRKNSTGYIDLISKWYDDGVEEDADIIAAFDWSGFSTTPESIATIIKTWKSRACAALINVGESTTDWKGQNFLGTAKKANPFKVGVPTFKNFWNGSQLNTTNVQLMIADMVARRGFNNEPLGFGLSGLKLISSSTLFPTALSITLDERLAGGVSNPCVKYKLEAEPWPHLAAGRWGIVQAGSAMDTHPVFGAVQDSPKAMILGPDSALYEQKNRLGYNVKLRLGANFMRDEAISIAVDPSV